MEAIINNNGLIFSHQHQNTNLQQQQQQQQLISNQLANGGEASEGSNASAEELNDGSSSDNDGSIDNNISSGLNALNISGRNNENSSATNASSQERKGLASANGESGNNIQVTQPLSAPVSPTALPGTSGGNSSTLFFLSSSIANAKTTSSGGSGTYICPLSTASVNGISGQKIFDPRLISNGSETADNNWQANKATVLERNAAMFNNELMSDVKFIVGGDFGNLFISYVNIILFKLEAYIFFFT